MMERPSNAIWLILGRFLLRALGHFVAGVLSATASIATMVLVVLFTSEPSQIFYWQVAGTLGVFFVRNGIYFVAILAVIYSFKIPIINVCALIATIVAWVASNIIGVSTVFVSAHTFIETFVFEVTVINCLLAWFGFKTWPQIFWRKANA